jgi:hypothetical protein
MPQGSKRLVEAPEPRKKIDKSHAEKHSLKIQTLPQIPKFVDLKASELG